MSKKIKFSRTFILGANKEDGIKNTKNKNKIKKAIEQIADEWIPGFIEEEHDNFYIVRLPFYNNESITISKKAVKQEND